MLHANIPESWLGVNTDRAAIARKLSPLIPEKSVFVLDDGFQHRSVRRDLDVVCLSESAFDDRMMPAGYLRESAAALSRAGVLLVIGPAERLDRLREVKAAAERRFAGKVCEILLQYPAAWVEARSGRTAAVSAPPFANPAVISGIARPERFLNMLKTLAVTPSSIHIFRDHHKFSNNDLARIHDHNIYYGDVVTTEKDAVRLLPSAFSGLREIWYLRTGLRFTDTGSEARVMSTINSVCHKH
jgi:tetraacyldisaccharide 4'-kinase